MLPQPRTPGEGERPPRGRERVRPLRGRDATPLEAVPATPLEAVPAAPPSAVALTRTPRGWAVVTTGGGEPVSDLVEGLTLADLVLEESGWVPEPDRSARRSARGPVAPPDCVDPRDERIAALERTVAQLEHALAARVATERAIGMLAERHGVEPRQAFDGLRAEARRQGRAVQEVAREVLEGRTDPQPRRQVSAADGRS